MSLAADPYSTESELFDDQVEFMILLDGYRNKFDQTFSTFKSEDLRDLLRFLPGVVVQKPMSMQGMACLYRIRPDLLERLIKSAIKPLKSLSRNYIPNSHYILDEYISGFLRDRDRSQHYYCNPMLPHISICRHFLSLLDGSNSPDLPS